MNAICWSQVNPDLVVSGDDLGNIVLWDVKANATRFLTFGRNQVSVLQTHPFDGDFVAFGCKQGLVFIVNVSGKNKSWDLIFRTLANSGQINKIK